MPVGHTWNLTDWMRGLGIRRKDQPDVVHAVQPTVITGDLSRFGAQLLTPMALAGGGRTSSGLNTYGAMKLTCRSPGGLMISHWVTNVGAGTNIDFHVVDSPGATLANVVTLTHSQLGPTDTESTLECGTFADPPPGTPNEHPRSYITTGESLVIPNIWVPSGKTFEIWRANDNTLFQGWCVFWECPAQPGPR